MATRHVSKVLKVARVVLRTFKTGAKCTSKGRFPVLHITPDEDTGQEYQNVMSLNRNFLSHIQIY